MHQTSANPIHQTPRKCEAWASIFVEMRDTVCLVQTSPGITFEAFFSAMPKLFLRKDRNLRPAFAEAIVPKTRAHGVRYARGFGEPLKIYHGLSFFFLRAVFLLSFSKEGRKMRIYNKKNN